MRVNIVIRSISGVSVEFRPIKVDKEEQLNQQLNKDDLLAWLRRVDKGDFWILGQFQATILLNLSDENT